MVHSTKYVTGICYFCTFLENSIILHWHNSHEAIFLSHSSFQKCIWNKEWDFSSTADYLSVEKAKFISGIHFFEQCSQSEYIQGLKVDRIIILTISVNTKWRSGGFFLGQWLFSVSKQHAGRCPEATSLLQVAISFLIYISI